MINVLVSSQFVNSREISVSEGHKHGGVSWRLVIIYTLIKVCKVYTFEDLTCLIVDHKIDKNKTLSLLD